MSEKNKFKETLNLPQTAFPMRANLAQNEPLSIKRWNTTALYAKIQEKTANLPTFVFHDGPPYANGNIHVGHLLNKVLKDIVVRSQQLLGKKCPFVPGWDCHGLPIEHKVMTELLKDKQEKLASVSEEVKHSIIRSECQKYASKYIKLQSEQMKRLLTLADYDAPYLTMSPSFESKVLEVFASLVKEDIVYRQLKPVHWSMANQTALAEAELEYEDKEDSAVYVAFTLKDQEKAKDIFQTQTAHEISMMIWTTTPWTLPANLAIAINPLYDYALVEFDSHTSIVAKNLLPAIEKITKKAALKTLGSIKGEALLGLVYQHPFCDRDGKIVAADYVTLEDGTGAVHTAPGHGIEDYQTGLRENLDIYCPVQGDGTYDTTVPEAFRGMHIWKANPLIVALLNDKKALFHHALFTHSYPHDWRSKTPVIFRSTEQWFISVDNPTKNTNKSLRTLALEAIESQIQFIPEWGKNRLRGMLEARPDWCISRQRSWGLPIPAFRRPDGSIFMTEKSIQAVAQLFESEGSDAWFKKSAADCLIHYDPKTDPEAPQDLDLTTLTKMHDIFDVWFESGSSWNAVLKQRNIGYPADLYLEGSDQHRGWFHLSLLPALGATGVSPFKSVLTHGFIVDKQGKKMSKSQGNALNVEDLLTQYGAEVTRWWVSSLAFENDIKVDTEFFDLAGESYRKVRNTIRFLLSNIHELTPADISPLETFLKTVAPHSLDAWILDETTKLQNTVTEAYKTYKFKNAHQALYNYCNDTLSSIYCTAVKDRLYCDKKDAPRRRQTQETLWHILEVLGRLLAPILPHTADELYQNLYKDTQKTIHLADPYTLHYTANPLWKTVLESRQQGLKALESAKEKGIDNTLDAELVFPKNEALSLFLDELPDLLGVSRVSMASQTQITIEDLREAPQCERSWKRDLTVSKRANGSFLSDRDFNAVNS